MRPVGYFAYKLLPLSSPHILAIKVILYLNFSKITVKTSNGNAKYRLPMEGRFAEFSIKSTQ